MEIEIKERTPVEKIQFVTTNFMRMWNCCHTSAERKAERMAALQSEFIRVFSHIDPIEIFQYATDEWIKTKTFVPTVAEFNDMLNARFDDWVPQEYIDKRSGLSSGKLDRVEPLNLSDFEKLYPGDYESSQEHEAIMRAIMGHD